MHRWELVPRSPPSRPCSPWSSRSPSSALAQQLSDDAIERALSTRGRALNTMRAGCAAGAPFGRGQPLLGSPIQPVGTISVTLATTAARIAQLAADRERRYEPALTVETLPDELREVALWVTTVPNPPTQLANITNIHPPRDWRHRARDRSRGSHSMSISRG